MPETSRLIDLPTCELSKLEEIADLVTSVLSSPIRREKLALALENEGYIKTNYCSCSKLVRTEKTLKTCTICMRLLEESYSQIRKLFLSKVEIVGMLQEGEKILSEVFAQITGEATDDEKWCELVNLFKEFCAFSQTLQPQNRDAKESKDKENLSKRMSSDGFKFTFSHPPSAANGTSSTTSKSVVAQTAPASSNGSSSKTANLATSVTATKGSLVGLVDYLDDEEEDEEEESSPRNKPSLS
ncbi:Serine/threonine-protein phosphatase 4 regulatory subunit 3B [Microtus ochrogaster]|uniref:Serine/threonine-protein phosphatase 4 regulatory subunit 3B n=1 Tax=Microtus ochrogaster TaxID=79684 RepID=A0A8J6G6N1_MICOH|nr:Serine/threonine-protein phosphatase 4 regulatory subunit 3B [Microtus ochrogaster]